MVLENECLRMKNVWSLRDKMTEEEISNRLVILKQFIKERNLTNEYIVTTTFDVKVISGKRMIDLEILCPIKEKVNPPAGFIVKSLVEINNALKISHYGNVDNLQESAELIYNYAYSHKLKPITPLYSLVLSNENSNIDVEQMHIDLYLGVEGNAF